MKVSIIFCGLATTAFLAGTPAAAQEGDMAAGATVYGHTCGSCHNARSPLERTDRQWVVIINHMRVRGNLTGRQVKDVLAFLQGTNADRVQVQAPLPQVEPQAPEETFSNEISLDAAAIAAGADLATQKACVGCHVIGESGGAVGPSLNTVLSNRDAAYVRRKLADPTFNNATSMMPNFGLTADEIDALVAYINSMNR